MSGPPAWLRSRLERALDRLDVHPDPTAAVRAVARRHEREEDHVLLTAGASEALLLLERVLQPVRPVQVHPEHDRGWDAVEQAPDDADVVLVGSPGPDGTVPSLEALHRPGRTVVVDEAWGDAATGSYGGRGDLTGLVVVRSLSRTWGVPALRAGYLLGAPDLVQRLRQAQQPWPLSALALTALETCLARGPVRAAERAAADGRERLAPALEALGLRVLPGSQAPYLLCTGVPDVREGLPQGVRAMGGCWRVAVPTDLDRLVSELQDVLERRSDP